MKDKLLWFCRTSDSSSLSRITDSIVPHLTSKFDITLFSNKTNLTGVKNIITGADTSSISYKDYIHSQKTNKADNLDTIRCKNMKYLLVQLVDLIYESDYKWLLICNGIYEIDWFTKILSKNQRFLINKNGDRTKLIVWAPIDYIPTLPIIQNALNADIFITMTPVMRDEIKKIANNQSIEYLGHGSDLVRNTNNLSRDEIISQLNELKNQKIIMCKDPIKTSDVIILNANNYGPIVDKNSVENTPGTRKRLDITLKAFLKILRPGVKLWIHTNLKSFFDMLAIENIILTSFIDNIILSNNNLSNEHLELIYKVSNISIQTSTAEGWSLTNLEASLYRSLQVVPDFLACGYHYKDGKGILIPVTRKTIKNEGGYDVIIGEVSIDDTANKLNDAIKLLDDPTELNIILDKAYDYANSYKWSDIANRLTDILIKSN